MILTILEFPNLNSLDVIMGSDKSCSYSKTGIITLVLNNQSQPTLRLSPRYEPVVLRGKKFYFFEKIRGGEGKIKKGLNW